MKRLVALHSMATQGELALEGLQTEAADSVGVLSLAEDRGTTETLVSRLRTGEASVHTVPARPHTKTAAYAARRKYIAFVAEWPERYRRGGRTFKELLSYRGEISLWWLSLARMKDIEASPTFTLLFQLELVATIFKADRFDTIDLVCEDPAFRDLVRQWARRDGVSLRLHPRREPRATRPFPLALVALASRLKLGLAVAAGVLLVRMMSVFVRPPRVRDEEEIVFFTLLRDSLRVGPSGLRDASYVDLPEYLAAHTALRPFYASFVHGRLGYVIRRLRHIFAGRDRLLLLEHYLSLRDVLQALLDWSVPAKYLAYEAFDPAFVRTFEYDGLNIHRLLRSEMTRSYVGPICMAGTLLMKAFERIAKERPIAYSVSFLELYPQGLAVYAGSKRGRPDVVNVAYQHAVVTDMKLWYCYDPSEVVAMDEDRHWGMQVMPGPDMFLCQGSIGRDVFLESGFTQQQCRLTGSPRYDSLGRATKRADRRDTRASLGIPADARIVLVPTTYARGDAEYLVRLAAEACAHYDDWFVVFKPHPADSTMNVLADVGRHAGFPNWAVVDEPIHGLIELADVVVTTYSTTADEAVALGCPVVIAQHDASFSMGTFWTIDAAPIIASAEELSERLGALFEEPSSFDDYRRRWPELVEGTFYRLDGGAKERVAAALTERREPQTDEAPPAAPARSARGEQ